jgi:hypothetical protein
VEAVKDAEKQLNELARQHYADLVINLLVSFFKNLTIRLYKWEH